MELQAQIAAPNMTAGDPTNPLGRLVRAYTTGGGQSWGMIVIGGVLAAGSLAALAASAIGSSLAAEPMLAMSVFLLPLLLLGLAALRAGIRNRRVRLTLLEHGFEVITPAGKPMSARYTDIQSVALRKVSWMLRLLAPAHAQGTLHEPNSLTVQLKGGWSLDIKCLSTKDLRDAHDEMKRRSESPSGRIG